MTTEDKFRMIYRLADIASDFPGIATELVPVIQSILGPLPNAVTSLDASIHEMVMFRQTGKVAAVRAYRNRTGQGLLQSKNCIEAAAEALFMTRESQGGLILHPSKPPVEAAWYPYCDETCEHARAT